MNGAGVTDSEMNKILYQNTCSFFGWEPFKHIAKADATVGALRAASPDVDTTVRSKHQWRELYEAARA